MIDIKLVTNVIKNVLIIAFEQLIKSDFNINLKNNDKNIGITMKIAAS